MGIGETKKILRELSQKDRQGLGRGKLINLEDSPLLLKIASLANPV
jgi:hypothetical protein